MTLTDTHTHLYSEAFQEDRDAMIQRALKSGIGRFFLPAIDSGYTQSMLDLEKKYPGHIFLMMGLHPTHVKENYKEELQHVEAMLASHKYYAVGEIGIDLYWEKRFLKEKQQAFKYQIELAKKYKLPIVIHCREAFDEIFELLEEAKGADLFGIFHCFTGTLAQAQRAIGYNMMLGIGGVVTFKNGKIDTFLDQIDLKHLVLETDSPYLAPVPYRGKRNESSYLTLIVEKLAQIYKKDASDIATLTTENALRVFGI
ncbi:MAG: TatD family deoxyribonuclease [Flavobacteriales bacterium]|nr:MAG: TatD family deoxyribonuclease [Flavobacteriales bacterium]